MTQTGKSKQRIRGMFTVVIHKYCCSTGCRFVDALFHTINGNFPQNQKRKKFNLDNFPVTMGALYFANEEDIRKFMAGLPPYKAEVSVLQVTS